MGISNDTRRGLARCVVSNRDGGSVRQPRARTLAAVPVVIRRKASSAVRSCAYNYLVMNRHVVDCGNRSPRSGGGLGTGCSPGIGFGRELSSLGRLGSRIGRGLGSCSRFLSCVAVFDHSGIRELYLSQSHHSGSRRTDGRVGRSSACSMSRRRHRAAGDAWCITQHHKGRNDHRHDRTRSQHQATTVTASPRMSGSQNGSLLRLTHPPCSGTSIPLPGANHARDSPPDVQITNVQSH